MSQFIINRNNMQDVREMCAFFAKQHKYEIERLAWQRDVLERKAFKYWSVHFDNRRKNTKKIEDELNSWFGDVKARYNHIIDAYNLSLHVQYMTDHDCFVSLQVDSVDIEMVINYYRLHNPVEHVVYDDDFIPY